jgi:hypothetical protein
LPVASLWASPDYKSVVNCPIIVSWILYLTKLISEIKRDTSVESRLYWANILLTTIDTLIGISSDVTFALRVSQRCFFANIRLDEKGLTRTNPLAYL